jgi:anti-sigma regulatory factor (Ser/Thr protein kinase)
MFRSGEGAVSVQASTDVAAARRAAMEVAAQLSFDANETSDLGLVVTEAARNLVKHGGGGELVIRSLHRDGGVGIEILTLDKGPGIADIVHSFRDGYSTAGTSGTGMGAIARLSSMHGVYSRPGQGTAVLAQLWRRDHAPSGSSSRSHIEHPSRFEVGAVCTPLVGEPVPGDDWSFQEHIRGGRLTVADGLGHGLLAADASHACIRVAHERPSDGPRALIEHMHGALRATRGAAVAVAEIDTEAGVLRYAGLGNICGVAFPAAGPARHLVSQVGTVGHELRNIQEFTYPWDSKSILVMHSDGLTTRWSFDPYPGLMQRHASLIAGIFYRDHNRGRDDATVVVIRETAGDAAPGPAPSGCE